MANERFRQLINELHQATLDGRVRWEETAKEGAFRVGLGDGLVRIQAGSDDEDNFCVKVFLLNGQGRIVDELLVWEANEDYNQLLDLYQKARSSALRIDEVVNTMLSDLKAGRVRQLPPEPQTEDMPF